MVGTPEREAGKGNATRHSQSSATWPTRYDEGSFMGLCLTLCGALSKLVVVVG
jgi:hypothetical protein